MFRTVFIAALLLLVKGKVWKEAKDCFEDRLESCYNKCKHEGGGILQLFKADKFVACAKGHKEEIIGNLKTCLKDDYHIDFAELEKRQCWEPVDETDMFALEAKMDKFAKKFPFAQTIVDCAKPCLRELKAACFKDCTAEEDTDVKEAFVSCFPKMRDAAKPIIKRCMKAE